MAAIMLRHSIDVQGDMRRDRRYGGTGEDPQVLAEAAVHGVRWITSTNFGRGAREDLNEYLAEASEVAGFKISERFIITAEEAMTEFLGPVPDGKRTGRGPRGYDERTRLAYLVATDGGHGERDQARDAEQLRRLTTGLDQGGMKRTAAAIEDARKTPKGWTREELLVLNAETRQMAGIVDGAIASDQRRRTEEWNATSGVKERLASLDKRRQRPPRTRG